MKRNMLLFVMVMAVVLMPLAAIASAPPVNSAVFLTRIFNDCPGSILTTTNAYPGVLSIHDVNNGCFGFANLHAWRFSTDGTTVADFQNGDAFRYCADVRITGNGAGEAGLQIAPWWNNDEGRLNMRTTDGEIACFGGRLPFFSFTGTYGLHYVMGDVMHLEITYLPNGLSQASPATIEYKVNGFSSGPLPFDQGNPAEDPPHGQWGILTPAHVGGHMQFFLSASGPTGDLNVEWANICFEPLDVIPVQTTTWGAVKALYR